MGPSVVMRPGGWFESPSSSSTGALGRGKRALNGGRLLVVEGSGLSRFLFSGGMLRIGDFFRVFPCPRFLYTVFVWLDQVEPLLNLWVGCGPDNQIFDPVQVRVRLSFPRAMNLSHSSCEVQ